MNRKPSTDLSILAALAIMLLLIGGYLAAYLLMGEHHNVIEIDGPTSEHVVGVERTYSHQWARTTFWPAGWIEGKLRGLQIEVGCISK